MEKKEFEQGRHYYLDKGKIVEMDSPENLLENRDSIFYSMAKSAGLV
jgi:ABC-type multidrug transport system fused ATPase/permease subunit